MAVLALLRPATAASQEGEFEETTRVLEVQIPVNVTDSSGQPIRGLTAEDFEVLDQGVRQEISGFEVIDLDLIVPDESRVMDIDYGIPGVARRYVLFLFDLSFSSPTALAKARLAAERFILEGMHPSDLAAVAVHTVESGTQLLLTFTPDRAQLARAITTLGNPRLLKLAVRDPLRFLIDNPGSDMLQASRDIGGVSDQIQGMERSVSGYLQVIGNQMAKMERSYARGHIASWTESMQRTADMLGSIEGRKHVIWFSEGFDGRLLFGRQPDVHDPEFQAEARAIEEGAVWMVDSDNRFGNTQLQTDFALMLAEFQRNNCVIQAVDISGLRADLPAEDRARRVGRDALFYLANETGGQLYEDANDFGKELGKVLDTSAVTYLLAFQPSRLRGAGEQHRLKVKLRGNLKGTVSHRMGYEEPRRYEDLHPMEKSLLAADLIATASVQRDLDVNVLTAAFKASDQEAYVPVIIEISGESLLVEHDQSRLPVELYAYATDQKGEMRDFFSQLVTLNLEGRREVFSETGLKYYGHLSLTPGKHLVRVVVRNAETGRTSSQASALEVPSYADGAPQLLPPFFVESPGSWFLVREQSGQSGPTTVYPFTVNGEPYVPSAAPLVGPAERAEMCLIGYNLGEGELRLDAKIISDETGEEVPGGRVELRERTVTGIDGLDKLVATFRASGLEAGRYTLEIGVSSPDVAAHRSNSIPLTVLD